ncbi:carboxypeptidase-like regulatory domain-containing protein [Anatilimnocola sp. NA78]|uniref:carboxypeptidase-like regulatory domain-containing protein n=1 Tax=Anatilimnocola sp. NA78 TaxID=3415683 RepID=UPI003CE5C5EA
MRTTGSMLVLLALFICGCSRREVLGPVSGVVTFDGKPVPGAMVLFQNEKLGVHMMARADETGRFVVQMANGAGLPLGEYQVAVSPPIQDHPLGPIAAPPPGHDDYPNIPKRYRKTTTSKLKLTVGEQANSLDINMRSVPELSES